MRAAVSKQPRIMVMAGPGTLPSQGIDRMDLTHYNIRYSGKPRLTPREMIEAWPEIAQYADTCFEDGLLREVATFDDLRKLALHFQHLADRDDIDGIVWIQGTNTLEDTAFFLNLTLRSEKPVIVVGAQRPFTAISTDAHLNLVNAIRVAACPEARGKGVLTVTNSEINAARDVTKTSTFQLQTFRSRDLGILGYADADRIVFYRAPVRRHTVHSEFDLTDIESMPQVEILYGHTGANPHLARAAVELGAKGLVMAGIGAGALGIYTDVLKQLASGGIVIVRSARTGEGRVLNTGNTYEEGMIAADNLNPQKSALLLSLAMTRTREPAEIQRMFDEY